MPNCQLIDCLKPEMFRKVVAAIRVVAGFDSTTNQYKTPSLAIKLGHSLRKCASILKGQGIKKRDLAMCENADSFQELCKLEWFDEVSGNGLKTLNDRQRNKIKLQPIADDVMKLSNYLKYKNLRCRTDISTTNLSKKYEQLGAGWQSWYWSK